MPVSLRWRYRRHSLADLETALTRRIHDLELDLTRSIARITSLELALRQRSMQLEGLDSCEIFVPPRRLNPKILPSTIVAPGTDETIAFLRPHLDGSYYLRENRDVEQAAMDPVVHYVLYGEREGRRPCPYFDPVHYRVMNPSLAQFNGSLFWYYLTVDQVSASKTKG